MSDSTPSSMESTMGSSNGNGAADGVSTPARPAVIQLSIKEKAALYAAYIPFFTEGGIFVPSSRDYQLGMDVYVLLTLPDDTQRYPIAGKVAWINPPGSSGARKPGIGIRFPNDEKTAALRQRIEQILGVHLGSDKPTQTL